MNNILRIKDNLKLMVGQDAPVQDIDSYLKSEGFTQDSFVKALGLTKQAAGKTAEYGTGRAAAQGLTFGFADEMEALAKSLAGQGTYEQNLAALGLAKQQFERTSPGTALTAEIAGGLPYAAIPFLGAARYAKMADTAGPLVRAGIQAGQSAIAGGVTGALGGAGGAEIGQRMAGAQTGATVGGVLGGALPVVAKGVGAAGGKVVDVTSGIPGVQRVGQAVGLATGQTIDAANRAKAKLLEAMYRDVMSPDELANLIAKSTKPVGIVDIGGENVKSLADVVQKYPGTSRQAARVALEERGAGQAERIKSDISRYLGEFQDPYAYTQQIAQRQKEVSAPLYESAYSFGEVTSPKVLKFLELPQFKSAAKEAENLLAAEGRAVDMTRPTVEVLDNVKRGLDALIEKETDAVTGKKTQLGKIYVQKKNEFLSALDAAVPDYGKARKAFAGDAEIIDATRAGQDFFKQSAAEAKRTFASLTPSEQEAYRIGAIDSVKTKIATAKDTADVRKRIFGSTEERDRMRSLFPDSASFNAFEKDMTTEATMRATQEKILRGSQTAERQLAAQGLEAEPGFLSQLIEQGPMRGTLGYLKAQGQGVAGQTAEELGPMLFKLGDPRANLETLKQLSAYERYLLEQEAKRAAGTAGAATFIPGLLNPSE